MSIQATASGGGYYFLLVDGVEVSKHSAEREALQEATNAALADPSADVRYEHRYGVRVTVVGVEPDPVEPPAEPPPDDGGHKPPPVDPPPDPPPPDVEPEPEPEPEPPPVGGVWPHEPTGFRLLSDRPVAAVSEDGWASTGQRLTVEDDASAPMSPPLVLQFLYPEGEGGPGQTVFGGTTNLSLGGVRSVYVGLWLKLSDPWQEHTTRDSPKLVFLVDESQGGGAPLVIARDNNGEIRAFVQNPQSPPNRFFLPRLAPGIIQPGSWHFVEALATMNSGPTAADGQLQLWADGVQVYDVRDLWYSDAPDPSWDLLKLQPLWGGQGATLTQTNLLRVDHVRVSAR